MLVGDICIYSLDGTLNSEKARIALVQCTDIIIESTIDPIVLAKKVYSKEIISEYVYKREETRPVGKEMTDVLKQLLMK